MRRVHRRMDHMDAENDSLSKQIGFCMQRIGVKLGEDVGDGEHFTQPDETWQCAKCGTKLGMYDPVEQVMRIKHKDLLTYVSLGDGSGGYITVVCRSCGETNTADAGGGASEGAPAE